jgi:eukaryotic-like serine/threonine-protein kinase
VQRGTLIDGRYTLGELLGSGGMGRVYRAYDGRLKREVALKVMAEHYAQTPEFVERFEREIRNVASLDHPNVIRVFDSGETEDGSPYMAMELASGGTLKDRIRFTGPLPPREAARVALQVAEALGAAHEAGIVHRDVKPENVLLTENGDVKVGDFGIARATEATAMTHTSMILGTAPYLSPEQARGEPVGPSSDLYSLGVVLYESLTGRTPFGTGEHLNPLAIAMKHCNEPAPSPRAGNRGVPEALELITLTLMRKRPEERHPDAAALVADLDAFLEGRGLPSAAALRVASSPEGAHTNVLKRAPVPAVPPRRRRRKVLPLMALALAAVLALFVSSPAQMQRPVAFVEHTIVPDAEVLDRAVSPALDGPPAVPRVPEEKVAEASRSEVPEEDPVVQDRAPRPDAGAAFSEAPVPEAPAAAQTGSASASAASSPDASASAAPEASAAPATEEAPQQEPAAPSAPASPAPQVPDASAPAEDPEEGPPSAEDQPVEVQVPEIEPPDL